MPTRKKPYSSIIEHYESCLQKYGDSHRGVDWPNQEDAETRYRVMLDVIATSAAKSVTLLDFGCGASHLYEYILRCGLDHIRYSGLDLSGKFISLSRSKFPHVNYYCLDILEDQPALPHFDYIVLNGVFTEKCTLSFQEMFSYFKRVVISLFHKTNMGIAFNVMSSHVEWEREDLFHLPLDTLADFLTKDLTRSFMIRNDYGLYEYTAYVYKRGVLKGG
jgi:cyclopropane fatty-acyl-phospholipid synthase-like methyltransferase